MSPWTPLSWLAFALLPVLLAGFSAALVGVRAGRLAPGTARPVLASTLFGAVAMACFGFNLRTLATVGVDHGTVPLEQALDRDRWPDRAFCEVRGRLDPTVVSRVVGVPQGRDLGTLLSLQGQPALVLFCALGDPCAEEVAAVLAGAAPAERTWRGRLYDDGGDVLSGDRASVADALADHVAADPRLAGAPVRVLDTAATRGQVYLLAGLGLGCGLVFLVIGLVYAGVALAHRRRGAWTGGGGAQGTR